MFQLVLAVLSCVKPAPWWPAAGEGSVLLVSRCLQKGRWESRSVYSSVGPSGRMRNQSFGLSLC